MIFFFCPHIISSPGFHISIVVEDFRAAAALPPTSSQSPLTSFRIELIIFPTVLMMNKSTGRESACSTSKTSKASSPRELRARVSSCTLCLKITNHCDAFRKCLSLSLSPLFVHTYITSVPENKEPLELNWTTLFRFSTIHDHFISYFSYIIYIFSKYTTVNMYELGN